MVDAAVGTSPTATADMRGRRRRILSFAARVLVQTWWFELILPKIGLGRVAERTRIGRSRRAAARFRVLAVDLGGLMIKVGQFLSSRMDVLPPEITAELVTLQDEVPAVPFAEIRALAEAELDMPLSQAYAWIDEVPVAAASLGQAHRARLTDRDAADTGFSDAIVKVQRPGIDAIVAVDLEALRRVAGWVSRVRVVRDRVDAPALVEEFAKTSLEETDYLHEAASAARFAEDFADESGVDAPDVAWERTTRRVLTLEDVTAIKINDLDGIRAAGLDPQIVAKRLAAAIFEQLFRHGVFHADPHPGNIFVTPDAQAPEGFRLTFIDFGMMGQSSPETRTHLRRLLLAVTARDGGGLVSEAEAMGVLLPSADTVELERALTALFARFGGKGFAELREVDPREFTAFADEFGEVMRDLPFQLPEHLLLIFRTVSLTSGVSTTLDPDFNVWDAVEPFAAQLITEQGQGALVDAARSLVSNVQIAANLPRRIDDAVTRLERGEVQVDTRRIERRLARLEVLVHRVLGGVLFAGLLVAGAFLRGPDPVLSTVLMLSSLAPLLYALLPRRH